MAVLVESGRGFQIAVGFQRKLVLEQLDRGRVTDGDEDAVGRDVLGCAGLGVFQPYRIDPFGNAAAQDLIDGMVPDDFDLRVLQQTFLQDAFGPQAVAAVHQGDFRGKIGEIERFFNGGVAAADDDHFLAAVKEAVAGGAGRDARPLEFNFGRQAEPACLGAGGDDQCIGGV